MRYILFVLSPATPAKALTYSGVTHVTQLNHFAFPRLPVWRRTPPDQT